MRECGGEGVRGRRKNMNILLDIDDSERGEGEECDIGRGSGHTAVTPTYDTQNTHGHPPRNERTPVTVSHS